MNQKLHYNYRETALEPSHDQVPAVGGISVLRCKCLVAFPWLIGCLGHKASDQERNVQLSASLEFRAPNTTTAIISFCRQLLILMVST